jgi:23S rRNA pseudouridine2605 synthase
LERLQKYIADCGIASRRTAEKFISDGRVSVNDKIVTTLGTRVNPLVDNVKFDGNVIKQIEEKIYIMLYKPKGYISTVKDDRGRKTVLDLLPEIQQRIFPVGRLDNNTEGLLLLTNDGTLTQKLLHPKFKIEKTYLVSIRGRLGSDELGSLRHGISLSDGKTAPAKAAIINYNRETDCSKIEMTIHEGRNRQIRRMFEAVQHDVVSLKRVQFAGVTLKGLRKGEYRSLTNDELLQLNYIINGE